MYGLCKWVTPLFTPLFRNPFISDYRLSCWASLDFLNPLIRLHPHLVSFYFFSFSFFFKSTFWSWQVAGQAVLSHVRVNYGSGAVSCSCYEPVPAALRARPGTSTHTPPTFSPNQSNQDPHLQPIPTPMCYHLTLLILCTQAHMEVYAQVYE